jgi:trehalose synthase
VIGSAVGGIINQIAEGTGILLPDPADLKAFRRAVSHLHADQAEAIRLGPSARACIRENYLGDIHLMLRTAVQHAQFLALITRAPAAESVCG